MTTGPLVVSATTNGSTRAVSATQSASDGPTRVSVVGQPSMSSWPRCGKSVAISSPFHSTRSQRWRASRPSEGRFGSCVRQSARQASTLCGVQSASSTGPSTAYAIESPLVATKGPLGAVRRNRFGGSHRALTRIAGPRASQADSLTVTCGWSRAVTRATGGRTSAPRAVWRNVRTCFSKMVAVPQRRSNAGRAQARGSRPAMPESSNVHRRMGSPDREKNAASYRGGAMKTRRIHGGEVVGLWGSGIYHHPTTTPPHNHVHPFTDFAIFPPLWTGPLSARTRFMSSLLLGRFAILLIVGLTGCGIVGPRRDGAVKGSPPTDRTKGTLTELAMAGSTRQPALADPSTMIPPPPRMDLLPDIPNAPPKDDQFVSTAVEAPENALVMASAHERAPANESNLEALRRVYNRVVESFGKIDGFECRLTRRETVNGRAMPEEVLQYKFRKEPYSVYIK